MTSQRIIFVVNLLQDINILRPLVYLAALDLRLPTRFLVTAAFRKRDTSGVWQQELADIAADTYSASDDFSNEYEALQLLGSEGGVVVAASESHLKAHQQVHDLFRVLGRAYVKITLQHGFECVGFLQSRDQNLAHGSSITFAADLVCGWSSPERLTAMAQSERHKLVVTGPTAVLQLPPASGGSALGIGLVCENMHSARLNVAGNFKQDFLDIFGHFCSAMGAKQQGVALRPHPGGQYVVKNGLPLPPNVELVNGPIYKLDLSRYAYGISAPSSILIDMVVAGIPTAVWQDEASIMDLGNYEGLTRISSIEDWLAFAADAQARPDFYRERQRAFLLRQQLQLRPLDVYRAYERVLAMAAGMASAPVKRSTAAPLRVQFFAPNFIPTLQLSFIKPLARDVAAGELAIDVVTETQLNAEFSTAVLAPEAIEWLNSRIDSFSPHVVVFCRWAGPHADAMLAHLARRGIPAVFHLDDDLLHIPKEIGADKWAQHNKPERLASVRHLLDNVDLVYCSTGPLRDRLESIGVRAPIHVGKVYCTAAPLRQPVQRPVRKIGYMGIGHEGDLASVLPAIVTYLRRHTEVTFELFGTIPIPTALNEFGDRVRKTAKIEDYGTFLEQFATFEWDIGICPLERIPFNLLKANTKWVEYTAAAVATVASRGTVYDDCCADGCGLLADGEDEWLAALESLTRNPRERTAMVERAQMKLIAEYSVERLRRQVHRVFAAAIEKRSDQAGASPAACRTEHIMFVSNSYVPTLQLSFIKPLAALERRGMLTWDFLSEDQLKQREWELDGFSSPEHWVRHRLASYAPSLIVFCRYSGPFGDVILDFAREREIAVIYHIDDDLLGIPKDIGDFKHAYHNKPARIQAVRQLLERVELVYASTPRLAEHLAQEGSIGNLAVGDIYCSSEVIKEARMRPIRTLGYMASADHSHNFSLVAGAVVRLLRKYPQLVFESFGSFPAPAEFAEFGERIRQVEKIDNYEEFLRSFAEREWDIGMCPLTPIHFNLMKANTKWVEYTAAGAVVVASGGTVYDDCCADGCGVLAASEEEWLAALERLVQDPNERFATVKRAQEKLRRSYSVDALRGQVLEMFDRAHAIRAGQKKRRLENCAAERAADQENVA